MKIPMKIILISILICAACAFVGSGETSEKNLMERILHFPKDRSLGRIMVQDADAKEKLYDFHSWYGLSSEYQQAQGDVIIPAGKKAALFLYGNALKDLSPLLNLKTDDLYMLSLMPAARNQPLPDKCMQDIAHLAGLKNLWLSSTTATTEGIKHITKLQSLEMLVPPKGLTNMGLSYIAQMESLKGLYFVESRVNNAGLKRYLSKLTKLEKLSLWSGDINDAGLVCLADLPKLRYLSLNSGNFTDAGLFHLKDIRSVNYHGLKPVAF